MPRRRTPDPLAQAIGRRIRALREARGLTMEKLAYETDSSKGFLSDVEKGLARPTLTTLNIIASRLDVLVLDLVTFPDVDNRQKLIDRLRTVPPGAIRRLLRELGESPLRAPPPSRSR